MDQPLTRLAEFRAPLSREDERAFAQIYESLKASPSLSMKTFIARYRALDEIVCRELLKTHSRKAIFVRDLAASNAITSLDLYQALQTHFGDRVTMRATDCFDALHIIEWQGWRVVFDARGKALQFIGRRLLVPADGPIRRRYWIKRVARWWVLKNLPQKVPQPTETILLWHPTARAAAEADKNFILGREDAYNPEPGSCDLLRVLNLHGLAPNAYAQVAPGGLLVLGDEDANTLEFGATVFRRHGNRFAAEVEIGNGYPMRHQVLKIDLV